MLKYLLFLSSLIFCITTYAQEDEKLTPEQQKIMDQFEYIKNNTNWDDQNAAAKAFKEMERLTRELDRMNGVKVMQVEEKEIEPEIIVGLNEAENIEYDILKIENEGFDETIFEEIPFLVIDMNKPEARPNLNDINALSNIQILVVKGNNTLIDLNILFLNLESKPLRELYIFNVSPASASLPDNLGQLSQLEKLGFIRCQVNAIPSSITKLTNLVELYLDDNPLAQVPESFYQMKGLQKLGIANTLFDESAKTRIAKSIPNCEILIK